MRAALLVVALAAAGVFAWRWSQPAPTPPAGERVPPVPPHEGRVSAVLPGPVVVSGDVTGRLVRWGAGPPTTFVGHDGAIRRLLPTADGFASVGADGSVARWGRDGALLGRLRLTDEPLNDAVLLDADALVASARGTVARLGPDGPRWKARGAHARTAFTVAAGPGVVWSGGADEKVLQTDPATGALGPSWSPGLGWIVAVFPEGDAALVVGQRGLARVGPGGVEVRARFPAPVTCAARDGERVAVGGEAGRVTLLTPAGEALTGFDTGDTVLALAFDGPRLLTGGGADGRVRIWQVKDGAPLGTLPQAPAKEDAP